MYVFVTYMPKYIKINLFIHLDYPIFQKKWYLTAALIGQTRTKYKQLGNIHTHFIHECTA